VREAAKGLSSFFDKIRDRIAEWAKDGGKSAAAADDSDIIFSLASSHITLDRKIGLVTTGRCALAIKANSGQYFHEMEQEVKGFLPSIEEEFGLNHHAITDSSSGQLWIILYAKKIEDLLAGLTAVGDTVIGRGFSSHILAAVFEFYSRSNNQSYFLVYDYKENKFYPFVPVSHKRKTRDNEEETRIMETMSGEMPFEKDRALWHPLWNLPL
jgi:hypothetical protein